MIRIIEAGIASSIQDNGRLGYKAFGVPQSGAFDRHAHNCSNILAGNAASCASIEIVGGGARLQFCCETFAAIAGADMQCTLNGNPVAAWSSFLVAAGDFLQFGYAVSGKCAYLAVLGGIQTPALLDSRSTYCRAGIGGIDGHNLRPADTVEIIDSSCRPEFGIRLPDEFVPIYNSSCELHCVLGPQSDYYEKSSLLNFYNLPYEVTKDADRMGCRLQGQALVQLLQSELISQPLLPGAVQVPKSGQPIVMLADAQTCGGYPIIAVVVSDDLSKLAQANTGDSIRFMLITTDCARANYLAQRDKMERLSRIVRAAYSTPTRSIFVNDKSYLVSIRPI